MNPVTKAIHTFFAFFDKVTSQIDIKTVVMIRQSYTLIIVLLALIGLFAGITLGRNAAHKGGVPIVEETRDIFEIDITREKERVTFSEMVDEKAVISRDTSAPQRAEQSESSPSFRTDNDSILEKKPQESTTTVQPLEGQTQHVPIERQLEISEREEVPGVKTEENGEVIIREDDKILDENTMPQESDSNEIRNEEWRPGSQGGDTEQNMVPLDRSGGIVE